MIFKSKNNSNKINRSSLNEKRKKEKLIGLAWIFFYVIFGIVVVYMGSKLVINNGEFGNASHLFLYFAIPTSALGSSVITVISLHYLTMKNFSPKNGFIKFLIFFVIFFFFSISAIYVSDWFLDGGIKRKEAPGLGMMGKLIVSITGAIIIAAIDECFKVFAKEPLRAGVLPLTPRKKLIVKLNTAAFNLRQQKDTRLFELAKLGENNFKEEVNQYINDIIKEYNCLAKRKHVASNPTLVQFCTKYSSKWERIRSDVKKLNNNNEILGLIGSEINNGIDELDIIIKKLK
ncbi:MAG: hypothetical protein KBT36_09495 [Kurthia sp.]|nr:hypothetical protein [Candidatus Kurthia equi]